MTRCTECNKRLWFWQKGYAALNLETEQMMVLHEQCYNVLRARLGLK